MNILTNYKNVILKNYVNSSGRASRNEYWCFVLVNIIINIVLMILDVVLFGATSYGYGYGYGQTSTPILSGIYSLAVLLPSVCAAIRRLHDTGKSGCYLLCIFIPLVGSIVVIVFLILAGEQIDNKFGPVPGKWASDGSGASAKSTSTGTHAGQANTVTSAVNEASASSAGFTVSPADNAYSGNAYGGNAYGGNAYGGNAYGSDPYSGNVSAGGAYGGNAYGSDPYSGNVSAGGAYGGNAYGGNAYGSDPYSGNVSAGNASSYGMGSNLVPEDAFDDSDDEKTMVINDNAYEADEKTVSLFAANQSPRAYLIRKSDGMRLDVQGAMFTLGKSAAHSTYAVSDSQKISRQHATIMAENGAFYVRDDSKNGTWVNDYRLTSDTYAPVRDGDILRLADVEFEFHTA